VNETYIRTGDRVRVKAISDIGRTKDCSFLGQCGTVESNDGWGLCRVRFDNGRVGSFWNEAELERAEAAKEMADGKPRVTDD